MTRKRVVFGINFREMVEARRIAALGDIDNEQYRKLYAQSGLKASVWVQMIGISAATHASYKTDRLRVPKERYNRMLEVVRHQIAIAKKAVPKRKYTKKQEDFLE